MVDDGNTYERSPSLPLRTVDEILLLYDSSSSSGSPSPPSSPLHSSSNGDYAAINLYHGRSSSLSSPVSQLDHADVNGDKDVSNSSHNSKDVSNDNASVHSNSSLENSSAAPIPRLLSHTHSLDSILDRSSSNTSLHISNSSSRLNLGDSSSARTTLQSSASISLPPLFTAIKSNVKPGAALAAAAAASRSIPTRNAAAMKSSRTAAATVGPVFNSFPSSNSEPSASAEIDTEEVHDPHSSRSTIGRGLQRENYVEEEIDGSKQFCDVQDPDNFLTEPTLIERNAESFLPRHSFVEIDDDGSAAGAVASSPTLESSMKYLDVDENSTAASVELLDTEIMQFQPSSSSEAHDKEDKSDEDAKFHSTNMVQQEQTHTVPNTDKENTLPMDEMHGQEDAILQPEDDVSSPSREDLLAETDLDAAWLRNNNEDIRSMDKKSRQRSMTPLEVAEELEKKQAFTGLHWEEGAAAQPMRLEGVRRESIMLGYFHIDSNNTITRTFSSSAFRREHGYPLVLSVHMYYIAIGMSKGVIIIVPSKYSPYHPDNMDAKMLMLGLQGDRSYAPVTSMCFNQQGEFLFAGYGDGHISVWDVQRASVIRVVTEHKAPVVHMLYLGQDSQVSKQLNVVSGDSKGVVKLIRFSFVPLVNKIYLNKATVLCNEKMGVVICASSLISGESLVGASTTPQGSNVSATSAIGSMMGGVIGVDAGSKYSPTPEDGVVVFVFHQNALVAKLVPSSDNVVKYAHIPKPEGAGGSSMPYVSWRSIPDSNGVSTETGRVEPSERASYLAIAWDRTVQVAKLVKSELGIYSKWTIDNPAVGVAWLDDQMLVILNSIGQLGMFTKDGSMIHETRFSVDVSRGDDLITYHTYFNNSYGNPEKAYHNCVAVRGASIYVLGPSHLLICRLLPWKERIEVLRRAGDWMGALNMAMTLYDGQAHGAIDLPRTLDDIKKTIMPYLLQLLLSYVDEVFSYIKVASGNQVGNTEKLNNAMSSSSDHPEIKEQYIRVGGVAVEFCVHIKRTDILFDEIYSKFDAAKHKETFLELLEPYILKDMLGCLPPEIMQALVEHYSFRGWLQRVEQCILHMDIASLDFNQVVRLCREHGLHGALIYLFNKGLDDFRTPLEELLGVFQNCEGESASTVGYRILVYLKYSFQGLAFPPGHGTLPATRLLSIREEILQFLLDFSSIPNSKAATCLPSLDRSPNLCHLLQLDTLATLDVLRSAFMEDTLPCSNYHGEVSSESSEVKVLGAESQNLLQKLVDLISMILDASYFQMGCSMSSSDGYAIETWPSKEDVGYMLEFITYYVACERAKVSRDTLSHILEYLTSVFIPPPSDSAQNIQIFKAREKQLLVVLDAVPDTDWDAPYLLHLCERCQFHQVCGFIHSKRHQYVAALDSYMKAVDEPVHAFSFIHDLLQQWDEKQSESFRAAIVSRVVHLVKLDREGTFFLLIRHFNEQSQILLSELEAQPECLFLYLKTLIEVHTTGNLQFSRLTNDDKVFCPIERRVRHQSDRVRVFREALIGFPKLLRSSPIQLTDEMTELYFELLCRYERESVRKFLETFESYRLENCLSLCQDYGIVDAAVFLLERVGDVGSALSLILSGLDEKFVILDASIGSGHSDPVSAKLGKILEKKEVRDIIDIVHSCIGLCQRNSPRLGSHESECLWFQLLDSFCLPLADSSHEDGSSEESCQQIRDKSHVVQEHEGACTVKWKILKSLQNSQILKKLISVVIREIVEGMIGHVPIPTIMLKLLSDNRIQEFGDIKPTILGMLGTYDFERRILDTAKSLIEDDAYYTMNLLKKEASHGYAPQDITCCICNSPLAKDSGIQVFSCSHALHIRCAHHEKQTSVGAISAGCPICVAGKNAQISSKTVLDFGLMRASTGLQKAQGTSSSHSQDNDVFEASYVYQPVSRVKVFFLSSFVSPISLFFC
ncbi:OLC1v1024674C6 [Oldenlandia corymbosa var. corymbosa]|nr:OLC1v1024674C6 [Oldenlandia corymbosa var. corymbosa]